MSKLSKLLRLILLGFTLAALVSATAGHAQGDARLELGQVDADNTPNVQDAGFPQLSMTVTPLNANGVPIQGLSRNNFTILEDGSPISEFAVRPIQDDAQGISVTLVLDISGSMREDLDDLRRATIDLLDNFLEQTDESAVITFSLLEDGTGIDLGNPFPQLVPGRELGFSNDEGAVKNLVNGIVINQGDGTPLYDALYKGARMAREKATKERRMVILMTDGVDEDRQGQLGNGSTVYTNADSVLSEVTRFGIPVFTVGLGDNIDSGFLQRVANATGGTFQNTPDASRLGSIFKDIAAQFKVKYVLDFESNVTSDNAAHTLELQVRTPLGDASSSTSFTAPFPVTPWVRGVQAQNPRQEPRSLDSFDGVKGLVSLQPDVVARGDIAAVNYYVNGDLVFSANEAPWSFNWNTRDLEPNQSYELVIEALDDSTPVNAGRSSYQIPVEECSVICFVEQQSGIPATYWLIGIGALLALLVLWMLMRARSRRDSQVFYPSTSPVSGSASGSTAEMAQPVFTYEPPPVAPMSNTRVVEEAPPPTVAPARPPAKTEVMRRADIPMAFLLDPDNGRQFRVQDALTIGSDPASDAPLDERSVSKKHAVIKLEDGQFYIHDLASTNGTMVNGVSVARQVLNDGDKILLGRKALVFKRV